MTWLAILSFIRRVKVEYVLVGVVACGVLWFAVVFIARGAKIERLTINNEVMKRTIASANERLEACAEISDALAAQQAATAFWINKSKTDAEEYDKAMDELIRLNRSLEGETLVLSDRARQAVRDAEGCEAKVLALAGVLKAGG